MKMALLTVLGLLALAAGMASAACSSAPKLPPGLPAPEYERPAVSPWPATDAGTAPQAEAPQSLAPAKPGEPADLVDAESGSAGAPGH
jgi:hypothetical protein